MAGPAFALPTGATVVAGQATVQTPSPTLQVITQGSDKAIIDWRSFSIAAGEKVRFYQPSSTSVTLNRVTGYDPSSILGQMQSNGRIFLLNPQGVVFGAGARIDVGGLVASSLSLSNADFLASRYSLSSVDAAARQTRGAVRNDGAISAPGGTVVLAGPSVTNTGTIIANGGRVGLAAANAVSIDVEGDGLVFFQASATDAKNRLEQLGRIQADGGTAEMRAAARGAFADTVLNVAGVVQAKSIGTREGRIVIDGGSKGITAVSGRLDASGRAAGERGGTITVQGHDVLLDNGARLEASGDTGGGVIRVGGDFHGANPDVRNAEKTIVAPGAELHADALTQGDGGKIVVWADAATRYTGTASAKGGAQGGNGGFAEVSGKQSLDFSGSVDMRASRGSIGTLLLDPKDIVINLAGADPVAGNSLFTDNPTLTANLSAANVVAALNLASLVLQANNDISVTTSVNASAAPATSNLTLQAGRTITFSNAVALTLGGGSVNLTYNDQTGVALQRGPGAGALTMNAASSIVTNGGGVTIARGTAGASAPIALTTLDTTGALDKPGGNVSVVSADSITVGTVTTSGGVVTAGGGRPAGTITLTSSAGSVTTTGALTSIGSAAFAGSATTGGAGNVGTLNGSTGVTVGGAITTTGGAGDSAGAKGAGGAVSLTGGGAGGLTVSAAVTVNADDATIAVNGGGAAIQLNNSNLTTTNNTAAAITVRNATTAALGNLTTGATGTTTLGVGADITGAVTQTAATAITTGTLTGNTASTATLGNANALTTLGAFTTNGAFTLNDVGGGLGVGGAVSTTNNGVASVATSGGNLSVAASGSVAGAGVSLTTTSANNIALSGPINGNAGTVTLTSGQAITQIATGTINTTGDLVLSAAGAITLDQGNTIGRLGAVTRGGA
ncbi:MAG TPA: filamentous hemagglutinin N-terminal domain-containing protein, partial [Caldimonas sp.]